MYAEFSEINPVLFYKLKCYIEQFIYSCSQHNNSDDNDIYW